MGVTDALKKFVKGGQDAQAAADAVTGQASDNQAKSQRRRERSRKDNGLEWQGNKHGPRRAKR